MASIAPNTDVTLSGDAAESLCYPPSDGGATLVVAVHSHALRVPGNALTQVAAVSHGALLWAGALDEGMLATSGPSSVDGRAAIRERLFLGERCWQLIRPGRLRARHMPDTLFADDRPWLVIGELADGQLLATPLCDYPSAALKMLWQPSVDGQHVGFPATKRCKLALEHVWSFPAATPASGEVRPLGRPQLQTAIRHFFS